MPSGYASANYFVMFVLSLFSMALNTRMCCILYRLHFLQVSMMMSDQYSVFANRIHQQANARSVASMINYISDQYQNDSLHKISHIATVVSLFCKAFAVCYGPDPDDNCVVSKSFASSGDFTSSL